MVRIGIFSDVHGCLDELHLTLNLFRRLEVEQWLCVGDLVHKGADSEGVVALMRALQIPCVQGNHDASAGLYWDAYGEIFEEETVAYLQSLSVDMEFEWEGVSVYVSHCNPWQDSSIYVYPTRPRALFEEIALTVSAQVIILGHTHIPMRKQVGDKLFLNPGALYGNMHDGRLGERMDDRRTCAVLTLPALQFDVYDIHSGEIIKI